MNEPQRLRHSTQVESYRSIQVHHITAARADDELFHVDIGRMEEPAVLRGREHRRGDELELDQVAERRTRRCPRAWARA